MSSGAGSAASEDPSVATWRAANAGLTAPYTGGWRLWDGPEGAGAVLKPVALNLILLIGIQSWAACSSNFEVLAVFTGSFVLKASVAITMEFNMAILVEAAYGLLAVLGARKGE